MAIDGPKGPDDPDEPDVRRESDEPARRTESWDVPFTRTEYRAALAQGLARSAGEIDRGQEVGSQQESGAEPREISTRGGQTEGRSDAGPDQVAGLRALITDDAGQLIGVEGRRKNVRMVSAEQLEDVYEKLQNLLGEPDQRVDTPKGTYEMWWISRKPRQAVTYRTFSVSGDVTVDFSRVEGLDDVKRLHIRRPSDD